jgi:hypothetical protein
MTADPSTGPNSLSRRRVLTAGGIGLVSVLSGCSGSPDTSTETDTTPKNTAVRTSEVYLGPNISGEVPSYVTVVDDATAADVAIVASDTTIAGETVVSWLLEGVPAGVYGEPAISRFLELFREGGGTDHFDGSYLSSGSEPHDIAVFSPEGDELHSYTGRYEGGTSTLVNVFDYALEEVIEDSSSGM